jgi:hypothetical protein
MTARKRVLPITLFVLVGVPLVAYLWETLNRLFAGQFEPLRLGIALVAAVAFFLLLKFLARTLTGWEGERETRR